YPQTVLNSDPADVTYTISQSAAGNPGTALEIEDSWTTPGITFSTFAGLPNKSFIFDPSTQGAIQGVNFSVYRSVTFSGITANSNATAAILAKQNGNFYFDSITGPVLVPGTFQTISATGLVSGDFQLVDFTTGLTDATQHPDFSASGGPIDFGLFNRLIHS